MATKRKKHFTIKDLEKVVGKPTVGKSLLAWRLGLDLSQAAFARKIGISRANLCDIEKGRKAVSPAKAAEIAKILGYSVSVLVGRAIEEQLAACGLKYKVELTPAA